MTQQYLKGELSLRLGEVGNHPDCATVPAVADLRRRVEDAPLSALPDLALEAMDVLDAVCWASLEDGDTAAFERESRLGRELHEFAVCAGLLSWAPLPSRPAPRPL